MTELASQTGKTVDLSVYRCAKVFFLDQVTGYRRLRTVASTGDDFPLNKTTNVCAALSLMQDAKVKDLATGEWQLTVD